MRYRRENLVENSVNEGYREGCRERRACPLDTHLGRLGLALILAVLKRSVV
jgi:hypothetical protein